MNGVFNTGLSFWQLIGAIFVLAFSIVAVKIAISFDINKYLERRDKKNTQKLKNACTHMIMEPVGQEDGQPLYKFQSLFESPPGTHQWQCQRCGLIRNHSNDYEERAEYYAKHPDQYLKQNEKFSKLLKKSGQV